MKPAGSFRWVVCGLLFALVSLSYMDRLIIGMLKKPIGAQLGWSEADYGYIAAGFSFAYAFGYLFGGRAMDILKIKRGLPLFVFVWCLAVAAHGLIRFVNPTEQFHTAFPWFSLVEPGFRWITLAMPMTVAGFVAARVVLGLAEGANFPAAIRTVAEWFPVQERAYATGWFNAGTNVGAVLCPIGVPWVYSRLGWSVTFYLTGLAGLAWLVAWWWLYDEPEKSFRLSPSELLYIQGQPATPANPARGMSWLALIRQRPVVAFLIASILAGPAWGFYQFFVPDFLEKQFHLGLQATGWWTGCFFGLTAVGGITGGWLAGFLLGKGWNLNTARKFALLACALSVVPVFLAPMAGSVQLAVLIVGLAGAAHQGWSANLYSVLSDTLSKQDIGSAVGMGGFVCFFTGGWVNAFTGLILEKTGSYEWVFAYFSLTYVFSLAMLHWLVPRIDLARLSPGIAPQPMPGSCQASQP